MQKDHTFTVDGLINGWLISGKIYSFENGWAYIRGGGLKPGGGLKVGFYGISASGPTNSTCIGQRVIYLFTDTRAVAGRLKISRGTFTVPA